MTICPGVTVLGIWLDNHIVRIKFWLIVIPTPKVCKRHSRPFAPFLFHGLLVIRNINQELRVRFKIHRLVEQNLVAVKMRIYKHTIINNAPMGRFIVLQRHFKSEDQRLFERTPQGDVSVIRQVARIADTDEMIHEPNQQQRSDAGVFEKC